ncbi:lipase member I [Halyomorpha halys]|uniref:lipase member I n=1 Tax=Halyomorpha halys TaxID=286706 RepID=UPI0006D4DF1D|nr:lipase member I-like [Halyomorpha halys]
MFPTSLSLLSLLAFGLALEPSTIKWVPSADQHDHEINPNLLVNNVIGMITGALTKTINVSIDKNVNFYYYSRNNTDKPILLNISKPIDPLLKENIHKPFKIVVHGYLHAAKNTMPESMRKEILGFHDANVIEVDWSFFSRHPWYFEVAKRTDLIGLCISKLLDTLVKNGANPDEMHLIGHSLGAHIAGFAGQNCTTKIARITGLDPALPGFKDAQPLQRLNPTDAKFVDCIHTSGGSLGFMRPICDVDFYPNGGRNSQPGCYSVDPMGICSHLRAPKYFQESVNPNDKFPMAKCPEIPVKVPVECTYDGVNMGYYLNSSVKGIYYGVTNRKSPFGVVELPSNASSKPSTRRKRLSVYNKYKFGEFKCSLHNAYLIL